MPTTPDQSAVKLAGKLTTDSRTLRSLIDGHGGFTLRLPTGSPVASGVSVATRPSMSLSFARDRWCEKRVNEWIHQVLPPSQWRTTCIGGWLDPRSDEVHLDVVTVVPRVLRWAAFSVGRILGQHCVFDLTNQETKVL